MSEQAMRTRKLGRTGLEIGEIGFGTWAIGGGFVVGDRRLGYGTVEDETSLDALARAFELGINFVDTSDAYGNGHSERLIGRALEESVSRVYVATKVGIIRKDPQPPIKDFSHDHIKKACVKSLERLGVGCIDLYQLHNPPIEVLMSEGTWSTLRSLQDNGHISHYGVSVNTVEEARLAVRHGDVATVQIPYNLLDRTTKEFFEEAEETQTAIIARSPLCSGLATGKYVPGHTFADNDHRRDKFPPDKLSESLNKIDEASFLWAPGKLRTPTQAALKFVLADQMVSVVIPGIKTPPQAEENAGASTTPDLTLDELDRISKIS